MSDSELACVYCALILHDAGVPISVSIVCVCVRTCMRRRWDLPTSSSSQSLQADKIKTLVKAAGVEVEPIWPNLFAKALEGQLEVVPLWIEAVVNSLCVAIHFLYWTILIIVEGFYVLLGCVYFVLSLLVRMPWKIVRPQESLKTMQCNLLLFEER